MLHKKVRLETTTGHVFEGVVTTLDPAKDCLMLVDKNGDEYEIYEEGIEKVEVLG